MSIKFVEGLLRTRRGNEYLHVIVCVFNKMPILMDCNKIVKGQLTTSLFFDSAYVHFGILRSIISDSGFRFNSTF